jgi:hypothetical protein
MSVDDTVTQQSQAGYKAFCKFFTLSTVAVIVALALMGLFLL